MEHAITEVDPKDVVIADHERRIKQLQQQLDEAHIVLRNVGQTLKRHAENNNWCKAYDEEVERYDGESTAALVFFEAARRLTTVRKTYRLDLRFEFSLDDRKFSEAESFGEMSAYGTYEVPTDFEPSTVDDFSSEGVRHVLGEDLEDWYTQAQHVTAEVEVSEDCLEED